MNSEVVAGERLLHGEPEAIRAYRALENQPEYESLRRKELCAIETEHTLFRDHPEVLRTLARAEAIRHRNVHHSSRVVNLERDDRAGFSELDLEVLPLCLRAVARPIAVLVAVDGQAGAIGLERRSSAQIALGNERRERGQRRRFEQPKRRVLRLD